MSSTFRLQGKHFGLTYSQASCEKQELFQHLLTLGAEATAVAQETHQDGNLHFHCALSFKTRKNIKRANYFDFSDNHPNIQVLRSLSAWIAYINKEDNDVLVDGIFPSQKRTWSEALSADTEETFHDLVKEISPRDYIIFNDRIQAFAKVRYEKPAVPYSSEFTDFTNVPTELTEWFTQSKVGPRPLSLILHGRSRLGKTEWARSLGRHMYFNGYFNLDDWDSEAEYAIFDDLVNWQSWASYKQWLGAQRQFVVTDKYRRKMSILWGKPCILLANELPMFPDPTWVRANCVIYNLQNKLY